MMTESLYDFFRGASGITMIMIGLGFVVEPERLRIRLAIGSFYIAVGVSLVFSWTSRFGLLPLALDNLLILSSLFVGSLSVFEIQLYVFGDEARRGMRRTVYRAAAVWSVLLWLLSFLDRIFGMPELVVSIEDGRSIAMFQSITLSGMNVLPVSIGLISLRIGRWKVSDVPFGSRTLRSLLSMLVSLLVALVLSNVALAVKSIVVYRIGQTLLQVFILGWYVYLKAVPDVLTTARKEIGREHKKKAQLDPDEVAMIQEKIRRLESVERIYTNTRLDPATLARALDIPVYKLTLFMTLYRGSTFIEWLHSTRIDYARTMLSERSGPGADEVAMAAGFASLTIFRSQFHKRVGMTPEAYCIKNSAASDRLKRKVPGRE
jgi:AraC-like DNA-binding protein